MIIGKYDEPFVMIICEHKGLQESTTNLLYIARYCE